MENQTFTNVRKLTTSGIVIALYVIILFMTQSFSSPQGHSKAKKKRESGLLPLNCVTNSCLLTKKEIG